MEKRIFLTRILRFIIPVFCVLVLTAGVSGCSRARQNTLSDRISNNEEIVLAVRKGLREHSRELTVRFSYDRNILDELTALSEEWIEEALTETDDPAEGDYIRYQYGGYKNSCRYEIVDGAYNYTVTITPTYYCHHSQEIALEEKLKEVMADFHFDDTTTDYEKVSAIYDYVCRNVRYDRWNLRHPGATLRSTAYSALVRHKATCQGYSVLLYRMLREAGLHSRIITGTSKEDSLHAWNIVELDGKYYNLDATWDAGKEEYDYFLKGTKTFGDHTADEDFRSRAFRKQYSLSKTDYSR